VVDRPKTAMPTPANWNLLSAHHLVYQVQALLERAESHAVLVTPYVDLWPSLELVMRQAVARGVTLHVVTRAKDDTHFEKSEPKRAGSLDRMKAFGATLHEVAWLHTKLYLNDKEAIISSFNLTATGRDGPNLGVHLHGAEAATQALQQVDQWIPGFAGLVNPAPKSRTANAFCIRCSKPRKVFDPSKPYCGDCWHKHLADKNDRPEKCCHRCGEHAETTLNQPTCKVCALASGDRRLAAV
jgi:hypothetical protein